MQAHRGLGALAADESLDRPVREHESRVTGSHARRVLRPHDRRAHERDPRAEELLGAPCQVASDHCGGAAFPCIASHTRLGVHGMSMCLTP
jgi:hypothetical protein